MRRMLRTRNAPISRLAALALLTAAPASAGTVEVLHALMDPAGLPALHNTIEDGEPKMWMPQLRLFDAEGRSIGSFDRSPARKEVRRALARWLEERRVDSEARTFREEARYFLRRGGLPLNLTTLPPAELTIVEYGTADCGQCRDLTKEIERLLARESPSSVLVIRVHIPLGDRRSG